MNRNLLLCLFGISAFFVAACIAHEAIVGGEKAKENQFPYQVILMINGYDECGAGIIDELHVITAGHCVVEHDGQFTNETLSILAGSIDLKKRQAPAVTIQVHKIFIPKGFARLQNTVIADIAVLKLKAPLGLSHRKHLKALELPIHKDEHFYNQTAIIAGFGWDWIKIEEDGQERGGNTDSRLRFTEVQVLDQCHNNYFDKVVDIIQLCARVKQRRGFLRPKKRGVCTGDSGGPLVHQGKTLIGILSVSPRTCSEEEYGGIYTRVSYFLDFIHHAVHDMPYKDLSSHVLPH